MSECFYAIYLKSFWGKIWLNDGKNTSRNCSPVVLHFHSFFIFYSALCEKSHRYYNLQKLWYQFRDRTVFLWPFDLRWQLTIVVLARRGSYVGEALVIHKFTRFWLVKGTSTVLSFSSQMFIFTLAKVSVPKSKSPVLLAYCYLLWLLTPVIYFVEYARSGW